MLTRDEQREYARLRAAGWHAKQALDEARTLVLFEQYEDAGWVRFRVEPDELYEVDLDPSCFSQRDIEAEHARVNNKGAWGIISEYRCPLGGTWEHADSVWGFIGDDWRDSGYDGDVRRAALDGVLAFVEGP